MEKVLKNKNKRNLGAVIGVSLLVMALVLAIPLPAENDKRRVEWHDEPDRTPGGH